MVLLTTHYMDEADALAQRIGIMVKGKLQVIGTPQHLKSVHGGGYRVELKGAASTAPQVVALVGSVFYISSITTVTIVTAVTRQVAELVRSVFSGVKEIEAHGGYQSFEVAQGFRMSQVFRELERAKRELGLENYTLSQTNLEQVTLPGPSPGFSPEPSF